MDALLDVTVIDACLRRGRGGSPTAVLADPGAALDDAARCRVASLLGTSHAVFVTVAGGARAALRFFTAAGELPACGHGTVAALAFLTIATGERHLHAELQTLARPITGTAERTGDGVHASFDAGSVALRSATGRERRLVLGALGREVAIDTDAICVASLGRERLLVPVASAAALAALAPDLVTLRDGCDRLGLLGCFVHSPPSPAGELAARMFAPSIGVSEDIANANSSACLAAALARDGVPEISVEMGDSLGRPATITAAVDGSEPDRVRVGGATKLSARRTLTALELG